MGTGSVHPSDDLQGHPLIGPRFCCPGDGEFSPPDQGLLSVGMNGQHNRLSNVYR
jgi:hypothetical protein